MPAKKRTGPQNSNDQVLWTIGGFCAVFDFGREVLMKRIRTLGITPNDNGLFLGKDLFRAASYTKFDESAAREKEAKAQLKEIELRQKQGELYDKDQIEEAYFQALRVVHSRVNAIANVYAARCNPADPAKAKKELEAARDHILEPIPFDDK